MTLSYARTLGFNRAAIELLRRLDADGGGDNLGLYREEGSAWEDKGNAIWDDFKGDYPNLAWAPDWTTLLRMSPDPEGSDLWNMIGIQVLGSGVEARRAWLYARKRFGFTTPTSLPVGGIFRRWREMFHLARKESLLITSPADLMFWIYHIVRELRGIGVPARTLYSADSIGVLPWDQEHFLSSWDRLGLARREQQKELLLGRALGAAFTWWLTETKPRYGHRSHGVRECIFDAMLEVEELIAEDGCSSRGGEPMTIIPSGLLRRVTSVARSKAEVQR
jgi:hypothetical protein